MTICMECDAEEEIRRIGEDLLDFCPACRTVDGETKEVEDEATVGN